MTLLEKCQKWHEAGQFPKIIEALEALGEDGRTPELASELARAYNNEADPNTSEGRLMLHRAIELLEPHEEALGATYLWNFRLGYAYYYLDQEGRALSRFRRAHEAKPEDEDAKEFMEDCLKRVTLPFFRVPFRERTQKAWTAFEGEEAEIRAMMDADKTHERGEEIVDRIERILRLAFEDVSFEVGFNGVKHELILTPEGNRMKLFELVYFRSHAPASVLRHWEITLGRRGTSGNELHAGGVRIGGEDVQAWLEPDDDAFKLSVFCARLADLKAKEEGRAWWMLTTLTDQLLGEIPHMRWINDFELLDAPRAVPGFLLSDLPDKLRELGKDLALDAETLLENSYVGYTREPDPDPDADWRLDVIAGSTACPPLINGYMSAISAMSTSWSGICSPCCSKPGRFLRHRTCRRRAFTSFAAKWDPFRSSLPTIGRMPARMTMMNRSTIVPRWRKPSMPGFKNGMTMTNTRAAFVRSMAFQRNIGTTGMPMLWRVRSRTMRFSATGSTAVRVTRLGKP